MTKQNIYQNEKFFEGYLKIREKPENYNELIESPHIYDLLNKDYEYTLDLGCGFGFYSIHLAKKGSKVLAVDLSEKMIVAAKSKNNHPNISYICDSIEDFTYKAESFDLVLSTLALHYIKDIDPVISNVYKTLKSGGEFVFSIEHPATRASKKVSWIHEDDKKYWPISDYFIRGKRVEKWIVENVVKYHRTISDYFYILKDNGFTVSDVLETEPLGEAKKIFPNSIHRPAFIIFKAIKNI